MPWNSKRKRGRDWKKWMKKSDRIWDKDTSVTCAKRWSRTQWKTSRVLKQYRYKESDVTQGHNVEANMWLYRCRTRRYGRINDVNRSIPGVHPSWWRPRGVASLCKYVKIVCQVCPMAIKLPAELVPSAISAATTNLYSLIKSRGLGNCFVQNSRFISGNINY